MRNFKFIIPISRPWRVSLGVMLLVILIFGVGFAQAQTPAYCKDWEGEPCDIYKDFSGLPLFGFSTTDQARCESFEDCCADDNVWDKIDVFEKIAELEIQYDACVKSCEGVEEYFKCIDAKNCNSYWDRRNELREESINDENWMNMKEALCVFPIMVSHCCPDSFQKFSASCASALGRPLVNCMPGVVIVSPLGEEEEEEEEEKKLECGDGTCDFSEDCKYCSEDCACPSGMKCELSKEANFRGCIAIGPKIEELLKEYKENQLKYRELKLYRKRMARLLKANLIRKMMKFLLFEVPIPSPMTVPDLIVDIVAKIQGEIFYKQELSDAEIIAGQRKYLDDLKDKMHKLYLRNMQIRDEIKRLKS